MLKKTIQHTTRMGYISLRIPFQIHQKSRNSLLQRTRLNGGYAIDTIFILSQVLNIEIGNNHSHRINKNIKNLWHEIIIRRYRCAPRLFPPIRSAILYYKR